MRRSFTLAALLVLLLSPAAYADEGMWTFHDFPQAQVKQAVGVDLSNAWLDQVRLATIRLSNCTASFVSPDGLILTNHHCAESCLDENSTSGHNLVGEGFLARTREQELKCGQQVADVLVEMENVSAKIQAATAGLAAKAANDKRKSTITALEQACEQQSRTAKSGALKCEMVNLYEGGQYWLYKYHRYTDVRLVLLSIPAVVIGVVSGLASGRWTSSSPSSKTASGRPSRCARHRPVVGMVDLPGPHPHRLRGRAHGLALSRVTPARTPRPPSWSPRRSSSASCRRLPSRPILGLAGGVSLGPENPIIAINVASWLRWSAAVEGGARASVMLMAAAATIGALFGTPVAAALVFTGVRRRGEGGRRAMGRAVPAAGRRGVPARSR